MLHLQLDIILYLLNASQYSYNNAHSIKYSIIIWRKINIFLEKLQPTLILWGLQEVINFVNERGKVK